MRGGGGAGCAHGDARVVSARARATVALRCSFSGDGAFRFRGERACSGTGGTGGGGGGCESEG